MCRALGALRLVMGLQCNMALRWFVGLNLDEDAWDASTFSQNRRWRPDESGLPERLFDDLGEAGYFGSLPGVRTNFGHGNRLTRQAR